MNYTEATSPRYSGAVAAAQIPTGAVPDTLRMVTFNVKFSLRPDLAAELLMHNDSLRRADVVTLQEMDERGVAMIADSLGMGYVYYPASKHPKTGRDFGNAILSRWPLSDDRKIILPHLARFNATQRIAVAATMHVGDHAVRVYSVHLATMVANGPGARREQLAAVLADADSFPVALIAGDFNSSSVPQIGLAHRLTWPTQHLQHTDSFWTLDHVLLRGLDIAGGSGLGIVQNVGDASDHRPVWAHLVFAAHAAPIAAATATQ